MNIQSLNDAGLYIANSLSERGHKNIQLEDLQIDINKYGRPVFHKRALTPDGLYHIKYQKAEHMPLETEKVRTAHAENERLKYVIQKYGSGNPSDIGLNLNVLHNLIEDAYKFNLEAYILNVVGCSILYGNQTVIYWSKAIAFYEFSMQWSTIIYDSKAYGGTVFLIPSGWMNLWSKPLTEYPSLINK